MSYESYAKEISEVCEVSSDIILEVLRLSEEKRAIYHGVKNRGSLRSILINGIEPKTPEVGYGSCWTTGLRLFVNRLDLPLSPMSTYDTSFFHYAHNDGGMTMAVTDYQTLQNHGIDIEWESNAQITIKQVIPPNTFSLLDLNLKSNTKEHHTERKYGILAEQAMLQILLDYLKNYSIGKRTYRELLFGENSATC